MLSTTKEVEDTEAGKDTRDMTRAQVVKSIFRVLTLKLGKANVPMLVTNHTYDVVGAYIPTKEMGGGSGLKYASSTIIYLSKKKEKDGKEVVGNIIKAKTAKSRLTKENADAEIRLYYDKYYELDLTSGSSPERESDIIVYPSELGTSRVMMHGSPSPEYLCKVV